MSHAAWRYVGLLLIAAAPGGGAPRPATIAEGTLLVEATLEDGLTVSVYGPGTGMLDEPTVVTVLILGNQDTTIASGVVIMAAPSTSVQLRDSPSPTGSYVPCGQWSPDRESEWRQLLIASPLGLWATRLVAMSHPFFTAGAGVVLDATIFSPTWSQPTNSAVFRRLGDYDQMGVAFLSDESVSGAATDPQDPARVAQTKGAHGIKVGFPIILRDPKTSLMVWASVKVQSTKAPAARVLTQTLLARVTPQSTRPALVEPSLGAPVISQPTDHAVVSESVTVIGKTSPRTIVTAWVEMSSATAPPVTGTTTTAAPTTATVPIRHMPDNTGQFELVIPLPILPASSEQVDTCKLHVLTEAPGYRSPETIRTLTIRR